MEGEFEIGSIGIQFGAAWAWGIDTVIPMRAQERHKAAWERLAADEAALTRFSNHDRC
jgi:hypothetical protein